MVRSTWKDTAFNCTGLRPCVLFCSVATDCNTTATTRQFMAHTATKAVASARPQPTVMLTPLVATHPQCLLCCGFHASLAGTLAAPALPQCSGARGHLRPSAAAPAVWWHRCPWPGSRPPALTARPGGWQAAARLPGLLAAAATAKSLARLPQQRRAQRRAAFPQCCCCCCQRRVMRAWPALL